MENKLQELTEKLYNEGLSKGKEEGARILEDARRQAAEIIAAAKEEAAAVAAKAAKDAEDLKSKVESDVRTASAHSLQATRSDIANLVVAKMSADKVSAALADKDFVKEIISSVAKNFSASESADLALVLPAALQSELEPWVNGELSKVLGSEVKASFSKKLAGGFTIGPKDGSWFIDLSEESFKALIADYLRPVTKKVLFGE